MKLMDLVKKVSEHLDTSSISDNTNKLVVGAESLDEFAKQEAMDNLESIRTNIALGFEAMDSDSEVAIEPYQIELATNAAAMAVNPLESLKSFVQNPSKPEVAFGAEQAVADVSAYADLKAVTSGFEAFDGQTIQPSVVFNTIFTALSTKQDPGAEMLFPVIPIAANSSGAVVTANTVSIINDFDRPVSGIVNKPLFEKVSLVKVANDPDIIDIDKNRLVPVLNDESKDYFVEDLKRVVKYNGEDVTTAPLKVGQEVSLLGISQTKGMLSRGTMNITDALDASVTVSALYFEMSGEKFKLDLSAIGAGFTYSVTDHNKDIILNLSTTGVGFNTTDFKKADGSESDVIKDLPDGYTVTLSLKLNGDGNTQSGDIAVYVNKLELEKVTTAGGSVLPEDDEDFQAIKEKVDTINAVGVDLESYLTNTNARIRGTILTADKYATVYNVPFRVGYTILTPVVSNGVDGDADQLSSAINYGRLKMNAAAYNTLGKFISYMRNTGDSAELKGIANKFVNKYFVEESLDLTTIVDGESSSERAEDIREALLLKLKVEGVSAYINSNYGVALTTEYPDVKPTLVVVTDPMIGSLLMGGTIKNEEYFDIRIAVTNNKSMKNRIVATFGIFNGDRNKTPQVLNFGQCFVAPDLVIPVVKTTNNSVAVENTVMNRYLHTINLPIMVVLNVSGINEVVGKVTRRIENK